MPSVLSKASRQVSDLSFVLAIAAEIVNYSLDFGIYTLLKGKIA